jgi:hypothetical protein
LRPGTDVVDRAGNDLVQGDRLGIDGQRAGLEPAHVEEVVDQGRKLVQGFVSRQQ